MRVLGSTAARSRAIEYALEGRPDVAQLLVDLRRELESGRAIDTEELHARFAHILNEDEAILETGGADHDEPPNATRRAVASYKL